MRRRERGSGGGTQPYVGESYTTEPDVMETVEFRENEGFLKVWV